MRGVGGMVHGPGRVGGPGWVLGCEFGGGVRDSGVDAVVGGGGDRDAEPGAQDGDGEPLLAGPDRRPGAHCAKGERGDGSQVGFPVLAVAAVGRMRVSCPWLSRCVSVYYSRHRSRGLERRPGLSGTAMNAGTVTRKVCTTLAIAVLMVAGRTRASWMLLPWCG